MPSLLVVGGLAAAAFVGWKIWQAHVAMTTPVTSLVTGGVYKVMNQIPGTAGDQALATTLNSSGLWSGVTASADGLSVTGTYTGPAAGTTTGVTVYKVG